MLKAATKSAYLQCRSKSTRFCRDRIHAIRPAASTRRSRPPRHKRRCQINERLERVRQHADGVCQQVRPSLECNRDQCGGDREISVPLQGPTVVHAAAFRRLENIRSASVPNSTINASASDTPRSSRLIGYVSRILLRNGTYRTASCKINVDKIAHSRRRFDLKPTRKKETLSPA